VRLLVDIDENACRTVRANPREHASQVLHADVGQLHGRELRAAAGLEPTDDLVVIGGAPCQPFSKAAYWTEEGLDAAYRRARARGESPVRPPAPVTPRDDSRRSLVQEFLRIVLESQAQGFVFENVPSLAHPRNSPILLALVAGAEAAGFKVIVTKANAAAFGVPQRRERVFVLGAKRQRPVPPVPTHWVKKPEERPGALAPQAVGPVIRPYAGPEFFEPEEVVSGLWAEHLATVPPGGNYKAHTAWAGHPNPTFVTETRYWNFLLKLSPHLPSWTLPATPGPWTGPFHWDGRRLRTPELAAIQGFPDNYKFDGSRRERVRQIGNAVPPRLAEVMVAQVLTALRAPKTRKRTAARTPCAA